MSYRSRILVMAVLAGLASAVFCASLTALIAWNRAKETAYDQMADLTALSLERLKSTIINVQAAFITIEAEDALPCSQEHIARMRSLVMSSSTIQEIGYIADGYVRCTSWGVPPAPIEITPSDLVTARGFAVNLYVQPEFTSETTEMIVVRQGSYNALIMPSTYVDVVPPTGYVLGFGLPDGRVVAATSQDHLDLISAALQSGARGESGDYLTFGTREATWAFAALAPKAQLWRYIDRQIPLLLPIGLLASGLLVGVVVLVARRRVSIRGELAEAIRRGHLELRYQPIVDLSTSKIAGAEALVRWRHPDGTETPPDAFVPLAEQSGLIRDMTAFVIRHAFMEMKDMLSRKPDLHISINLSAADLADDNVLKLIADILSEGWLQPGQVWLELTERAFLDATTTCNMVARARAMGLIVAIDDFGTGYSSLAYLRDTPLNILKIDKAFVDSLGKEAATSGVTHHIIAMARTLNLQIVAEGIETEDQAKVLRAANVEFGQGWLFSKPLSATDFAQLVRDNAQAEELAPRAAVGA